MRNSPDIFFLVPAGAQHVWNAREVRNGFEIHRRLLAAESTVEVGADA